MKFSSKLEQHRFLAGEYSSKPGDPFGAFKMRGPCGAVLVMIADDGAPTIAKGWEHVSVSTERRIPNWTEMCFVKDLFWPPEDCVVQFHPPTSQHINIHPNVLHLWRPSNGSFPMPPSILV